jgi:transcriptional regulator with GAF, ATPase, and Fis domain
MDAHEKQLVMQALEESGWVVRATARALKMSRSTLLRRMQVLGIVPEG